MARDRVNVGFGPSNVTVTGTTAASGEASTWIRFGPFLGERFAYLANFSTDSTAGNRIRMQGRFTSGSTKGQVNFTLINSSNSGTVVYAGSTGVFNFVRALSTSLANTRTVTVTFAAVN